MPSIGISSSAASPAVPRQETVCEVLQSINETMGRSKQMLLQIDERMNGAQASDVNKAMPVGGGVFAQAFEARSQAQQIYSALEQIFNRL